MVTGNKGFEIAINIRRHILRVRLWGLWDVELAKKYKYALAEKMREIHGNGGGWYGLADFTRCYPKSEKVQYMIREYIEAAGEQGMKNIVYLGDKSDLQLRLDQVFSENGEHVFAGSEQEAIQYLFEGESYGD